MNAWSQPPAPDAGFLGPPPGAPGYPAAPPPAPSPPSGYPAQQHAQPYPTQPYPPQHAPPPHHSGPQPHHGGCAAPAAAAAAAAAHARPQHAGQVAVVDARYCFPSQAQLVLQEQHGHRSDNFSVMDAQGRTLFIQDAKFLSMGDKRVLLDAATAQPVVGMARKMMSLRGAWVIYKGGGFTHKVAEVKPAMSALKPTLKVFLNDGDSQEDFIVVGSFRAKKFEVRQVRAGADRVLATVAKESKYSSATAFLMSTLSDADKYLLTVEPGVDAAFIVALAALVDEFFHDQSG